MVVQLPMFAERDEAISRAAASLVRLLMLRLLDYEVSTPLDLQMRRPLHL